MGRNCFWIVLSWIAAAVLLVSVPSAHSQTSQHPEHTSTAGEKASLLERGGFYSRNLSRGDRHRYRVELDKGQFLHLHVESFGITARVTLFGPNNQAIVKFACRSRGPTPLSFISDTSGAYELEIVALEQDLEGGRYEVVVEELRKKVAKDDGRITAEVLVREAETLRDEWVEESSRLAIERYEEALPYLKTTGQDGEEARALRSIAEIYHLLGKPEEALDYLENALRLCRERNWFRAEAETLGEIGSVYLQIGRSDDARECFREALRLSQEAKSRRGEALALNGMGNISDFTGDPRTSLELHGQALSIWRVVGDRRGVAQTLLNMAYSHIVLWQEHEALQVCEEAIVLWRALNDRRGEAETLRTMGILYREASEYQKALDLLDDARRIFEPIGDQKAEAALANSIGTICYELDEEETALSYFEEALRLMRAAGYRYGEASSLLVIGRIEHDLGDSERALDRYRLARSLFHSADDRRMESMVLREIGNVHSSLGEVQKALAYYNDALGSLADSGDRHEEAFTLRDMGYAYHQAGEHEKALDFFDRALSLFQSLQYHPGEAETRFNIARMEQDTGNYSAARSQLESTLAIAESIRSKVLIGNLRSSFFASVQKYHEMYIDLLMVMHHRQLVGGLDSEALRASERARSRSLLDSLTEANVDIRQGVDPDLLARERSLERMLSTKAERQVRLLGGGADEEELAELAREIRELTTEYEQVQAQIKSKSPRYAALTQPEPLSLQEIQGQVLDDETLLLEYSLGDERSYLWAVTNKTHTSYELAKREEIEEAAQGVYELLTARQPLSEETVRDHRLRVKEAEAQYWEKAGRFSEMVLGQVAEQLPGKRLLVVGDGALQYVPFGALPIPGNRGETGDPVPLVVEHEIVNMPSASTLAVLRKETTGRKSAEKAVAVLADPVFEPDDPRLSDEKRRGRIKTAQDHSGVAPATTAVSDLSRALRDVGFMKEGRLRLPRLPSTRGEANAIIGAAPPGLSFRAVDFQASRQAAMSPELGQYRIVHFATHGLLNNEHPELSGIVLSTVDEQGNPQDGFLRLHDIYNLELPAELVVLSTCSSGLGKQIRGEGLVGIVRGFMYAGAERVVASLWKVDDEATGDLMKHFYQEMLKNDLPPAAALRQAQIAMWKQKQWRSPFFWAAFVLQGEWK